MLQSVVTGGTLVGMKPISGYNIAAKTGTAEVAEGGKGYGSQRIISVAGMAPAEDPQYVVTVTFTKPQTEQVLERSGSGVPHTHVPGAREVPRRPLHDRGAELHTPSTW